MTCASSKDSDQPGHLPSDQSLHCPHEESLGPLLPNWVQSEDSDQTVPMLSLRWVHMPFCWFSRVLAHIISDELPRWAGRSRPSLHIQKGPFLFDEVHLMCIDICTGPAEPDRPCLYKQCRSRSVGFWRSQLIWTFTVCHQHVNLYQQPRSSNLIG